MYAASSMRKSFKDSLKILEADIQHANTLASEFPSEYDGACVQMRMSYSPAAHLFLFLVQWTDCHLAGALGLFTWMARQPCLLTKEKQVLENFMDKKQKAVCMERYRRRDEDEHKRYSEADIEREDECGICMEMNRKIVLPNCSHAMRTRSRSCPFCRDSLKRVNSGDLWVFMDSRDIVDMATITRENLRRLFLYIDKLPEIVPDSLSDTYDSHLR
ncbi:hypothetical protein RJ641_018279 [Dillenia turbinata]|uniref:RING-type domain-containing protein n=1 Tax=Dillenia turbinata TaxID=194707 RepID=A0AAN8UIR0_9MAGN